MEISYTDEFNRQGTVYFVNDNVNEQLQYVDSDSDTMSTCSTHSASTITSSEVSGKFPFEIFPGYGCQRQL
jgi:hypothetical protein